MYILALAAFAGGLVSALAGWADSGEPFNARKFLKSGIAALVAAAAWAIGLAQAEVTPQFILVAFVTGAGAEALSNRALGALARH